MGMIIVSFPGYLSYKEMPGNENSYREMPGNENTSRKKSIVSRAICIRTCACGGWGERGKIRMAREARKSRKYEGQLTKPMDR